MAALAAAVGAVAIAAVPASAQDTGYWMLGQDGAVYAFGGAQYHGAVHGLHHGWVDIEPTPTGNGYYVLTQSGAVYEYGDASIIVDPPAANAGDPWASLTLTPTGRGFWVFSTAGRVGTVGDAQHHGDMAGQRLNAPVVGSAVTPGGRGYWMVAKDGGVFSFGDAEYYGSTGDMRLNEPVTGMAPDPDGAGYWLVAEDGGIFAFAAPFYGSMGDEPLNRPVNGIVTSPTGRGYLMVALDGGIFAFGDVPFHGSLGATPPQFPIVAVAAKPILRTPPVPPAGQPPAPEPPAPEARLTSLAPLHGPTVKTGDTWGYTATTSGPVDTLAVTFLRPDGKMRTKDHLTKQPDGTWRYSNTVTDSWPRGTFQVTGLEINGKAQPLPAGVPTTFTVAPGVEPEPEPQHPVNLPPKFVFPAEGQVLDVNVGTSVDWSISVDDRDSHGDEDGGFDFRIEGLPPGLEFDYMLGDRWARIFGVVEGPARAEPYRVTLTVSEEYYWGGDPAPPGYEETYSATVTFYVEVADVSSQEPTEAS